MKNELDQLIKGIKLPALESKEQEQYNSFDAPIPKYLAPAPPDFIFVS